MNINFTEVLILNYLLKNMDKSINEYHIFNEIKEFDISSSEMVLEILKLKNKNLLEEIGEENKKLFLTPTGLQYAKNVIKGRQEYLNSISETLLKETIAPQKLNSFEEVEIINED